MPGESTVTLFKVSRESTEGYRWPIGSCPRESTVRSLALLSQLNQWQPQQQCCWLFCSCLWSFFGTWLRARAPRSTEHATTVTPGSPSLIATGLAKAQHGGGQQRDHLIYRSLWCPLCRANRGWLLRRSPLGKRLFLEWRCWCQAVHIDETNFQWSKGPSLAMEDL